MLHFTLQFFHVETTSHFRTVVLDFHFQRQSIAFHIYIYIIPPFFLQATNFSGLWAGRMCSSLVKQAKGLGSISRARKKRERKGGSKGWGEERRRKGRGTRGREGENKSEEEREKECAFLL